MWLDRAFNLRLRPPLKVKSLPVVCPEQVVAEAKESPLTMRRT